MGRQRPAGLYKRGKYWRIDKSIKGRRINESTGTSSLEEAERYLAKRVAETREAVLYGQVTNYTFEDAVRRYLRENMHAKSIADDASRFKRLLPYLGKTPLASIHDGTMQPYIDAMRSQGRKSKTVNNGLELTRRLLRKAGTKWRDEVTGKAWIQAMPLIDNVDWKDKRQPYPISWEEQKLLIAELAPHLVGPSLFALHTGCREQEICQLRWDWEVQIPELGVTCFVLPAAFTKNGEERVVMLNSVAESVIDAQRGQHPVRVFTFVPRGKKDRVPLNKIYGSGWQGARVRAAQKLAEELGYDAPWGFQNLRVHDLRHTFGRRLRSAGVSKETRAALLGHRTGDITTHYSAVELGELLEAVRKIATNNLLKNPPLTLIRAIG